MGRPGQLLFEVNIDPDQRASRAPCPIQEGHVLQKELDNVSW